MHKAHTARHLEWEGRVVASRVFKNYLNLLTAATNSNCVTQTILYFCCIHDSLMPFLSLVTKLLTVKIGVSSLLMRMASALNQIQMAHSEFGGNFTLRLLTSHWASITNELCPISYVCALTSVHNVTWSKHISIVVAWQNSHILACHMYYALKVNRPHHNCSKVHKIFRMEPTGTQFAC